jgi:hypothetical protein
MPGSRATGGPVVVKCKCKGKRESVRGGGRGERNEIKVLVGLAATDDTYTHTDPRH